MQVAEKKAAAAARGSGHQECWVEHRHQLTSGQVVKTPNAAEKLLFRGDG